MCLYGIHSDTLINILCHKYKERETMFNNDAQYYPYPMRRRAVFARNGMVATSQPLAAQAGLDILKKGGNAIDAAVATAAALTVLEPTSNGIGSDAFAIVWTKGKLHGLNSSGPAPKSISIEAVKERGHDEIPKYGLIPVTVPGAPGAWAELNKEFGKLSLSEVLAPAVKYAREGYPVSPVTAASWNRAKEIYAKNSTEGVLLSGLKHLHQMIKHHKQEICGNLKIMQKH